MASYHIHFLQSGSPPVSKTVEVDDEKVESFKASIISCFESGKPFVLESESDLVVIVPGPGCSVVMRTDAEQRRVNEEHRRAALEERQHLLQGIPIVGRK